MADRDDEVEETASSSKDRQGREQDAAMNRMSDAAPEQQLDEDKVKQAMAKLRANQKANDEAKRNRERELASVKISQDDVDVLAAEFEVDKKVAERRLREHQGVLKAALQSFL